MALTAVILLVGRWTYGFAFKSASDRSKDPYQLPPGKQYEYFKKDIHDSVARLEQVPCEWINIKSVDGLNLAGRYYHKRDNGPVILFFHGYRSPALRDFSGGFWIYYNKGYNILMVDQRGHGQSEGDVITLGIRERHDCLEWVKYCEQRFGTDTPLLVGGISMGAATVLMAAELLQDCKSVKGLLADCGYSSVEGIMKSVIKTMKLPVELSWWLVKWSAKLYGGFDVEESSAKSSLQNNRIPVIFIHGEEDRYVPSYMSYENAQACKGPKEVFLVPKAGHGMSFYMDKEGYDRTVVTFVEKLLKEV